MACIVTAESDWLTHWLAVECSWQTFQSKLYWILRKFVDITWEHGSFWISSVPFPWIIFSSFSTKTTRTLSRFFTQVEPFAFFDLPSYFRCLGLYLTVLLEQKTWQTSIVQAPSTFTFGSIRLYTRGSLRNEAFQFTCVHCSVQCAPVSLAAFCDCKDILNTRPLLRRH